MILFTWIYMMIQNEMKIRMKVQMITWQDLNEKIKLRNDNIYIDLHEDTEWNEDTNESTND